MCCGTLKVTKYHLNIVRLISQRSFSCRITARVSAETQLCWVGTAALADGSGLHLWNGFLSQVTHRVGASLLVKPRSSSEGTEEPLLSDRLVFHRHVDASVPPTLPSTHREIPAKSSIDSSLQCITQGPMTAVLFFPNSSFPNSFFFLEFHPFPCFPHRLSTTNGLNVTHRSRHYLQSGVVTAFALIFLDTPKFQRCYRTMIYTNV